ncbi:MAG TPA: hypothetical protein VEA39_07400 [Methylophilaceae bacterium]|nr:hypothetical protein [Methylophilaceae bacterium]
MAGEWLKLELATPDKPEIIKAARILGIDKDAVLGKLVRVWAWFDRNSVDGVVDGIVEADIDALAFQSGFAAALKQVHWMDFDNEKQWVSLVNFDRHNGDTAKQRALKNQRQAKWRAGKVDAEVSTETSTREEKRRDKENIKRKMPDDFEISESNRKFGSDNGINLDFEFQQFLNHHKSKDSKFSDWNAALRTWLGNSVKFSGGSKTAAQPKMEFINK